MPGLVGRYLPKQITYQFNHRKAVIMTIEQLIAQKRGEIVAKLTERNVKAKELQVLRSEETTDEAKVIEIRAAKDALDLEVDELQARVAGLEEEAAKDAAADALTRSVSVTAEAPGQKRATAEVTSEPRAYSRETDPKGGQFIRDVVNSTMYNDSGAHARLARHMDEERVERGEYMERAVGTGAFAGLTVPQYLVDLVAPNAKAGRPFADACRHHDLPSEGLTVNISKITTGTGVDLQATENTAVAETGIDDTLLTVNVQTNAGQQTLSRQAIERSTGAESIVLEDLFRAYNTRLDTTLINQATNGLTNIATNVAYTDATPTAAELYPKLSAAASGVESALLDMDAGDTILVMHSRRWHWLNSNLSTSWPLIAQPGVPVQTGGVNNGGAYGSGFRGTLPNGMPVIVDNNISTALGAGTEDEIYAVARSEAHLWEDPNAPVFIRAEQPAAASLGVLLVAYGYFAYSFNRRAHVQKISGTGLIAPTFA